jgi:hypothetical protein
MKTFTFQTAGKQESFYLKKPKSNRSENKVFISIFKITIIWQHVKIT